MEGSTKEAPARATRRPKSIRTIFLLAMVLFAAIATGGAITLAVYNIRYDRMFEAAALDRVQARTMVEIRLNFLLYDKAILLFATSGNPEQRSNADLALTQVWQWLNAARQSMTHVDDRATLQAMEDRLHVYIRRREELLKTDLLPGRQSEAANPEFIAILSLVNEYLRRAEAEYRVLLVEITDLNWLLTRISFVAAFVLPFAFLWMVLEVRSSIFSPFDRLGAALNAYSSGDLEVRAPILGPAELQEMALSFNDLADQLQRQREDRYQFLLGVAHDLRNPLTALKGHMNLATRQLAQGEASHGDLLRRFEKVSTLVKRLDRLVADLVDVTRMEAGQFDLQLSRCSVCELVLEVRTLYEGASEHHPITLDLPPEGLYVRCDETRMSQILINLLSNAIKYSPEGSEIVIRVRREGGDVVIEVQDWGVGIAPEQIPLIFQPFHRIEQESVPGAGLGLSVALGLVEIQGGRLRVESTPGVGSIFRILLPEERGTDRPGA